MYAKKDLTNPLRCAIISVISLQVSNDGHYDMLRGGVNMNMLIRRRPFRSLMPWRAVGRVPIGPWAKFPDVGSFERGLLLDVIDKEDEFVVKAVMPGVKAEDIDIKTVGNTLTIKGEFKAEEHVEEKNYVQRELRYGSFSRAVALPGDVEADKAEAVFEDGVLTLTLPKSQEAKAKTIKVEAK